MFKDVNMDKDQLKKFLAWLCMASLISNPTLIHC
jgi:radical SAM modification target selenobiotic family peptide